MAKKKLSRFESSQVISMFPTLVWKTQFKTKFYETINKSIVKKLNEMTKSIPKLIPDESWQSEQTLHTLEEFQELFASVNSTASGVLEFLRIGYDAFEITSCWANINTQGTGHRIHSHPNNFLSGVYYVQIPEGANTINFHDPRLQTGIIRPPVTQLTSENTDQVVVEVKEGTFLLFPSWLQHSVDPSKIERSRISISFNLMFSAYTEKMSKPLW